MARPNINLGDLARDTITGFTGVAVSKTEWLNGCVRVQLQNQKLHEGKPVEGQVFDIEQMELVEPRKVKADPSGGDRPSIARARDPK